MDQPNQTEMEPLTEEQTSALYESQAWETWDDETIVKVQLFQDKVCVDWFRFTQAMERVLGRPVFTHEYAFPENLQAEYLGLRPAPTFEDIVALIPAEKLVVVSVTEDETAPDAIPDDDDSWVDETPLEVDGWQRLWRKKDRDIWYLQDGHYAVYIFNHDTRGTDWTAGCRGNIYTETRATGLEEARAQARAALVALQEQDTAKGEPTAKTYACLSYAYDTLHEIGYRGLSSTIGAVMQALWYDRPHVIEGIVTVEDCLKALRQVRGHVVEIAFRQLDQGNIDDYMMFMDAAYNLRHALGELGADEDNADMDGGSDERGEVRTSDGDNDDGGGSGLLGEASPVDDDAG